MADYTTGGIQQQDASIYIGKTFMEKYEVKKILGQGAMGVVLKVWDTLEDVFKAIKVVPPQMAHDELSFKGLKKEVNAASKVSHPNVIDVHSLEKWEGLYFIVMEYVEGKTLATLLAENETEKLPEDLVMNYMKQVCDGLKEAHKKGVIHLDLKPQNIMVTNDGEIKILDFSISYQITKSMTTLTGQNLSAGTLPYMAPEQVSKKFGRVNEQTDIWGLGATMYHLLSGEVPFETENQIKDLEEEPYELEGVSAYIEAIVSGCMEKDRTKRYKKVSEIFAESSLIAFEKNTKNSQEFVSRLPFPFMDISNKQAEFLIKEKNYSHSSLNINGEFINNYNQRTIYHDKVIIDEATGLMWHKSGSSYSMSWKNAIEWIKELNKKDYAGLNNWRFPTLDEGASLLENNKNKNGLFIDNLFAKEQKYIWTGDSSGSERMWSIGFLLGVVGWRNIDDSIFVRPVRNM